MTPAELRKVLDRYDSAQLTLCSIGSHSALEVASGARAAGLKNLIVTARGREKTYSTYFAKRASPQRGCVEETLELEEFADLLDPEVQDRLLEKNVLFVANRSFEVYLHQKYSYREIERGMRVPLFGNRALLRAEERGEEENQYALLQRAQVRHPRQFRSPDEIDCLVMVKAPHAQLSFERAFFLCSSPGEYAAVSARLMEAGMLSAAGLASALIEEYAVGPSVNLNFFYSPLLDELELCGTDTRRQTNLDGLKSVPPAAMEALANIPMRMEEAGHIATTLTESMLEKAFAMGERFVRAARELRAPGVIGPFALQCIITAGPPKDFVCYDVSLRIPGSPGTRFTPYSAYRWGRDVSVGERIAMEVVFARDAGRLPDVLT
ncbi:MAG: formate--phosphoribosylaminoimidazolecarboxamideligase family protein [Vulcanimicrobiaceae bacterium]